MVLTNSWNEFKTNINLDCIRNYVNSGFNICCNELKIKFLVSKNIKYEAFEINLYHNESKLLYINSFSRIEICNKKDDRLYRNEYLQDKGCQNTMEKLKNEIKEHVNKYKQNKI